VFWYLSDVLRVFGIVLLCLFGRCVSGICRTVEGILRCVFYFWRSVITFGRTVFGSGVVL